MLQWKGVGFEHDFGRVLARGEGLDKLNFIAGSAYKRKTVT